MRTKTMFVVGVMLWLVAAPVTAAAQQYDARRNGDVVQLEDKKE